MNIAITTDENGQPQEWTLTLKPAEVAVIIAGIFTGLYGPEKALTIPTILGTAPNFEGSKFVMDEIKKRAYPEYPQTRMMFDLVQQIVLENERLRHDYKERNGV
jgi:hypothetical protein